ncbi:MAG: hypothetical protein HQM13_15650 [SAR324 cluster bacterium]|nr:hypothetical protein [SAR324 cluster bacterium]
MSNTRVTINPATVGLVDRFHFQYGVLGNTDASTKATKTERELSTFVDQFTLNREEASVLAPDGLTEVSGIEYEEARLSIFNMLFVWPFDEFSLGVSIDNQRQIYGNGSFLDLNGDPLTGTENETGASESFDYDTFSYLAGIAFKPFSLGIRYNIRTFNHNIKFLNPFALINQTNPLSPANFIGSIDILGTAEYVYLDYGILFPNFLPKLDIGLTYRPSTTGTLKFDQNGLKDLPPGAVYKKRNFTEPALMLVGFGYIFELGGTALQLLGDLGSYSETDENAAGESGSNGNRAGGLIRFVWSPLIDISYGVQEETLAGLTYQNISTSLQFPIPFIDGYNLKLGTRTIKLTSEGSTIIDVTFATFSFNLQFGERRGRALEVPPKTKEIRFIDRL